MSLGLSNVAGLYYQNYVNQQGKVSAKNRNVNFGAVLSAGQAENTGASDIDAYTEYLKSKYGNEAVQSVGKDQKSLDNVGLRTAGTRNVVIAPNILEEMANDPEKAAYYEGKIQNYFNSVPRYEAELSAMGHEIHSSGIIIHPDGTVTHYISGDLKPEERAKIEAKIKEEKEEKAKRRQEYAERSQETEDKRRQLMENYQHNRCLERLIQMICWQSAIDAETGQLILLVNNVSADAAPHHWKLSGGEELCLVVFRKLCPAASVIQAVQIPVGGSGIIIVVPHYVMKNIFRRQQIVLGF